MGTISEKSFGARLGKGQETLNNILGMTGYDPQRDEEKPAGFGNLMSLIFNANMEEARLEMLYTIAVNLRSDAYRGKVKSVLGLLSPIRNSIISQYGKDSYQYEIIMRLIRKVRSSKVTKAPAKVDEPDAEKKISQSEQSYNSISQHALELIFGLEQLGDYEPSNSELSVANLLLFAQSIKTLNENVTTRFKNLKIARDRRRALYDDLRDRIMRIKSYVRSHYGEGSEEDKLMSRIKLW